MLKAFLFLSKMIEKIVAGAFYTNSYVISNSNNECIVVDPGLGFEQAAKEIKKKYLVKAILITHGHIDHIDGIQYFNVPIYMHEKEIPFLYDSTLSLYSMMNMKTPYKKESNLNIIPVHDLDNLSLIGYTFEVLHTPGHTRGSVCYKYKDKVLSGDTLFHQSCGRTDFPTGDFIQMQKSLKRILSHYPDSYDVYPGHEEKTSIKNEKNNPFLRG